MAEFVTVLVLPERAFREARTYRRSRLLLILALFLLHVSGSGLVARFYATPYVAGLALQERENEAARFAFGHPPDRPGPGQRSGGMGTGAAAPAVEAVSVVVRSLLFILLVPLTWRALVIFTQFFGGDEEKTEEGPHRNSLYLLLYAFFPLALRRLLEGLLIRFQDPTAAWSASTLDAYRRDSSIGFSPLSLFRLPALADPIRYLLTNLTDPFFLWFLFILVYGGKAVFRLSQRAAFLQAGFAVALFCLYRVVSMRIGISIGV